MFEDALAKMISVGDAGSIDACNRMGNLYFNGTGVRRDRIKAAEWYGKSSKMGDWWARSRLDSMKE